ncbi:MAG: hypothetical protein ACFFE8_06340 [Candidatus Heimdallarchaeota archaeon]
MAEESDRMENLEEKQPEISPSVLKTRGTWNIIWIVLTILAIETLGFVLIRVNVAQSAGETIIVIDLFTPIILIFGALTLGYLYYTRYVRRSLTLGDEIITFVIGKKTHEYRWRDFSMVSLAISTGTVGVKGFLIRLYEEDIKGEYIDLPIYRFSKDIDVFDLRRQIAKKLETIRAESKSHQ